MSETAHVATDLSPRDLALLAAVRIAVGVFGADPLADGHTAPTDARALDTLLARD